MLVLLFAPILSLILCLPNLGPVNIMLMALPYTVYICLFVIVFYALEN